MNTIAVCIGSVRIYWSAVTIALAALCFLLMALSAHMRRGRSAAPVLLMFVLSVVFAVAISRFINWYCHGEQYVSFLSAFTDYSNGGYCIISVPIGIFLAAWLVSRTELTGSFASFADDAFFGLPLAAALIRLSALFDDTCRSKIVVTAPGLMGLPFSTPVTTAGGTVEYRFATFFIEFLLMLIAQGLLLAFRRSSRRRRAVREDRDMRGYCACMSIAMFDAIELIMDSTRYDSSFAHFNGFVSIVQMFCAITMLIVLIMILCRTGRSGAGRVLAWVIFVVGVGVVGVSEYLVQRHGNWHVYCYAAMSVGVIAMLCAIWIAYRTATRKKNPSVQASNA